MDGVPFGFRVLGDCGQKRRLVEPTAALHAYASCDARAECESEAYLSAFHFPSDFRKRAYAHDYLDVAEYEGVVGADRLPIDIDREDNLDLALTETRRIVGYILDRYRLDDDDVLVCFSGSKGFHVEVPMTTFAAEPSAHFHRVCHALAAALAERAGVGTYGKHCHRLDQGIYDRVRLWRAVNSHHPKTGRFKRRLTVDALMRLSITRIQELARAPEPFDLPEPAAVNDQAAADWNAADQRVQKELLAQDERQSKGGPATLNRLTREIICDGGDHGDRHRFIFSAAANLAEFSSIKELAYALLTEPGINCGLTPNQVARQIRCGLAHGLKKKGKTHE